VITVITVVLSTFKDDRWLGELVNIRFEIKKLVKFSLKTFCEKNSASNENSVIETNRNELENVIKNYSKEDLNVTTPTKHKFSNP
jgi:hypothetical protein